jgi:hypothetical protein
MHRDLTAERFQSVVGAARFERDKDADAAESVDDLAVHVMACARRSVMFSPMVAMALAIASATVPPPG